MINNKNNLDKLFEGLKQEKPLLSANEIQQIILNIEQNEIKSIKKNKIMTQSIFSFITLVVISTTLILFNNNPSNTENLSNQTDEIADTRIESEQIASDKLQTDKVTRDSIHRLTSNAQSKDFQNQFRLNNFTDFPIATSGSKYNVGSFSKAITPKNVEITDLNNDPILKTIGLNKQEMAKLGIYTKADYLLLELQNNQTGKFKAEFRKPDALSTTIESTFGLSKLNIPIPLYITGFDEYYTNISYEKNFLQFNKEISQLLPVSIKLENGDSLLLWYENSQSLIKLLPIDYQEILRNNEKHFAYFGEMKHYSFNKNPVRMDETYSISVNPMQVLNPSSDLLFKLGIKSTNPIHYYRRNGLSKLEFTNNGFKSFSNSRHTHKIAKSLKSLFPSYITKEKITNEYLLSYGHQGRYNVLQNFLIDKTHLIALKVKASENENILFWYKPEAFLLKELNENDQVQVAAYLALRNDNATENIKIENKVKQPLTYAEIAGIKKPTLSEIKSIELKPEQLAKLGIFITDNGIRHYIKVTIQGKEKLLSTKYSKFGSEVDLLYDSNTINNNFSSILPREISDIHGHKRAIINPETNQEYVLERLIPILVTSKEAYLTKDKLLNRHLPDLIFWYEPEESFLALLEERMKIKITEELEALQCKRMNDIINKTETSCNEKLPSQCDYVNLCETNLKGIVNKYKIYPNPATDIINIEILAKSEGTAQIGIYSLNGASADKVTEMKINKGKNLLEIRIKHLVDGIYVLKLKTNASDQITERILIKNN